MQGQRPCCQAALGVCIFSMVLASFPAPRAILPFMVKGAVPPRPGRRTMRAAEALGAELLRMTRARDAAEAARYRADAIRRTLSLGLHLELAPPLRQAGGSLVAALGLADAIARLQALRGRAGSPEEARSTASAALERLAELQSDPAGTAVELEALAAGSAGREAAGTLREAAAALRAGSALLAPTG